MMNDDAIRAAMRGLADRAVADPGTLTVVRRARHRIHRAAGQQIGTCLGRTFRDGGVRTGSRPGLVQRFLLERERHREVLLPLVKKPGCLHIVGSKFRMAFTQLSQLIEIPGGAVCPAEILVVGYQLVVSGRELKIKLRRRGRLLL